MAWNGVSCGEDGQDTTGGWELVSSRLSGALPPWLLAAPQGLWQMSPDLLHD